MSRRAMRSGVRGVAAVLGLTLGLGVVLPTRGVDDAGLGVQRACAAPEAAPLIPRTALFGNPDRANPKVSPDGKRLAFLRADDKDVMQVFVGGLGAQDATQVTRDKKRGIRDYSWGWDSESVVYLQDEGGDENTHVFLTSLASRETRDLTPFQGVKAVVVASRPEKPRELLVAMNRRSRALFDLWHVDLDTGALTLVEANPGTIERSLVDRQMRVLAHVLVNPAGGGSIEVRDAPEGAFRPVLSWGAQDDAGAEGLSADGKTLWLTSNVGTDTEGLYALDVATGTSTLLASDPGADVGTLFVLETTGAPQAASFARAKPKWTVLDPQVAPDFEALAKLEPAGAFAVVSRDLADATWIVSLSSDVKVPRWVRYDRATKAVTPLFSARSALEAFSLAPVRATEVKARDGLDLPVLVTVPAGVEPKGLPAVVLVHGGPWARDRWGFDPQAQWLANRGYVVLQVNYRGSSGFGKSHMLAARKEFAGKMHTDLLDALDGAVKEGLVDPKRVGIMGGSYGGYATLVGLTFTPDVFACGVDIVGPSNLVSLIESFPPYWAVNFVNTWYPYVGDPKDPAQRKDMEARSPLFKVDAIKVPLLVGQGANDPRVTKKEADQIVDALKKRGGTVEYVVYPDEGHGFAIPRNRLDFYGRAEAFLARWLGGRAE